MAILDEEKLTNDSEVEVAFGEDAARLDELREPIIEPEVVENKFKSPFDANFGSSSVDLTTPGANDKMLEEYNEWWRWDRKDPKREVLREAWNQKYYGMSTEEFREANRANATTMYGYSPALK